MSIKQIEIGRLPRLATNKTKNYPLETILDLEIPNGTHTVYTEDDKSYSLKQVSESALQAYTRNKDVYKELKDKVPAYTFACTLDGRGLKDLTGLLILDVDNPNGDPDELIAQLKTRNDVLAIWKTFSGVKFNILVRFDPIPTKENFEQMFWHGFNMFKEYGAKFKNKKGEWEEGIDVGFRNPKHPTSPPYNPDIYVNWDAEPIKWTPNPDFKPPKVNAQGSMKKVGRPKGETRKKQDASPYFSGGNFVVPNMVCVILDKFKVWRRESDELWIYDTDTGVYKEGQWVLEQFIAGELGDLQRISHIRESITGVRNSLNKFEPEVDLNLSAFKNGVFNWLTGDMSEHNPNHYLTSAQDYEYKQGVELPAEYKSFLESLGPEDEKETSVRSIMEMVGSVPHKRSTDMGQIFLLVGTDKGRNGKGLLCKHIQIMVSRNHCRYTPFSRLGETFGLGSLENSLCMIDNEVNRGDISDFIKEAARGEPIEIQKKYLDAYDIIPVATWITSCNRLPNFKDKSGSMFERIHYIEFPNSYTDDPQFKLYWENYTKQHKSEIMSACIDVYRKAFDKKKFTMTEMANSTAQEHRDEADHYSEWLEYCVEELVDNKVKGSECWKHFKVFKGWKNDTGRNTFYKILEERGIFCEKGSQGRVFHDIQLVDSVLHLEVDD